MPVKSVKYVLICTRCGNTFKVLLESKHPVFPTVCKECEEFNGDMIKRINDVLNRRLI